MEIKTEAPIGANVLFSKPTINGNPGAKQLPPEAFSGLKFSNSINPKKFDSFPIIAWPIRQLVSDYSSTQVLARILTMDWKKKIIVPMRAVGCFLAQYFLNCSRVTTVPCAVLPAIFLI